MKRIVVLSVLLAAGGATAQLAPEASSKPRTLEVVIDRDANLALVPEGTVIPQGITVSIPADEELRLPERRLVLAYAPAERFKSLREFIAKVESERTPALPVDTVWTPIGSGTPTRDFVSYGCPAQVFLEAGPGVLYSFTCTPYPNPNPYHGYVWTIEEWVEQEPGMVTTTAMSFIYNLAINNWYGTWRLTQPEGHRASHFTQDAVYAQFALTSRLVAPCTQDPPWCPPTYTAIVKLWF